MRERPKLESRYPVLKELREALVDFRRTAGLPEVPGFPEGAPYYYGSHCKDGADFAAGWRLTAAYRYRINIEGDPVAEIVRYTLRLADGLEIRLPDSALTTDDQAALLDAIEDEIREARERTSGADS